MGHEHAMWREGAPMTVTLPRGAAVIIASYLMAARALPEGADA